MCLAIPMRVKQVRGPSALCEARGIEREASLLLLLHESIVPGDFVAVHLGHAIQKISERDAEQAWQMVDLMLGAGSGG
jgi:hydrogenase expression/formation protein HypC